MISKKAVFIKKLLYLHLNTYQIILLTKYVQASHNFVYHKILYPKLHFQVNRYLQKAASGLLTHVWIYGLSPSFKKYLTDLYCFTALINYTNSISLFSTNRSSASKVIKTLSAGWWLICFCCIFLLLTWSVFISLYVVWTPISNCPMISIVNKYLQWFS